MNGTMLTFSMKVKKFLKSAFNHNLMRHRQHHRMLHNLGRCIHDFGPGRSLMLLSMMAMAGRYLKRRHHRMSQPELPALQDY